jgi:hypothetical protein
MSIATELSAFDDPTGRRELLVFGLRLFDGSSRVMASTVARRLSTLASFYRYCEQEGHVERSPAAQLRRPKVDGESRTLGLDRNELNGFMVQAGIGTQRDHALASLLGLNGLRVSEALNADIDDLGFERGHHVLQIIRKRRERATVPLASRTARAVQLCIDGRTGGPIFLGEHGQRMDRHAADRTVTRLASRAGIKQRSSPTASDTASSPSPSTPASPYATSKMRPATPTPGPPCATTGPATPSTGTPATSSPPSSPAPTADHQAANDAGRSRYAPLVPEQSERASSPAPERSRTGLLGGDTERLRSGVGFRQTERALSTDR